MGKKILLVDDDEAILEALQLAAQLEGYQVITLSTAEEVIPTVKTQSPDLIVLDVLLNGYDGRIICQKLKMNGFAKDIPVILVSAHLPAAKSFTEYGANDFVAKPFDIDDLLGRIKKLLPT